MKSFLSRLGDAEPFMFKKRESAASVDLMTRFRELEDKDVNRVSGGCCSMIITSNEIGGESKDWNYEH